MGLKPSPTKPILSVDGCFISNPDYIGWFPKNQILIAWILSSHHIRNFPHMLLD